MIGRACLIHYHEIGLKGKNRKRFELQLIENLKRASAQLAPKKIKRLTGHILLVPASDELLLKTAECASRVPGIARVSLVRLCARELAEYAEAAREALSECDDFETFKVHARRSNTDYELDSIEINREVGSVLCDAFPDKIVKVHKPDVTVQVLISQGTAYVWARSIKGVGGLPVGTAGKVVSLLSSGIDSPVATWMLGRRGAICVPIHFSGRPMTSDTSEYLVQDIVEKLSAAGCIGRLYVVPFGAAQREIALKAPDKLRILLYRRLMFCVAERLAKLEGAKALVTGESLGQVASQTLENICATNEVVDLPVLRPLIGSDKTEIIARAEEIGTFDISTQTAPDCCTLFMPRSPETKARPREVHAAWEALDLDRLLDELMKNIEYLDTMSCPSYKAPRGAREFHKELAPLGEALE